MYKLEARIMIRKRWKERKTLVNWQIRARDVNGGVAEQEADDRHLV